MELWHGSDRLPAVDTWVSDWPGVQPKGEFSEHYIIFCTLREQNDVTREIKMNRMLDVTFKYPDQERIKFR
eukprot:1057000-Amphidinium_carterae.1